MDILWLMFISHLLSDVISHMAMREIPVSGGRMDRMRDPTMWRIQYQTGGLVWGLWEYYDSGEVVLDDLSRKNAVVSTRPGIHSSEDFRVHHPPL
jgi:hypothetical protein